MQTYNLFATILVAFTNGAKDINFDELATFTGLRGDSGKTESCLYDPLNGVWRFWDRTNGGEADSLSGSFPFFDDGVFDQMVEKTGNATSTTVAGTVFIQTEDGNFVYIADIGTGGIFKYNVDEGILEAELETGKESGVNGLCYDEEGQMLYATNVGVDFDAETRVPLAGIANVKRFNLGDNLYTAEAVYTSGDPLYDSSDELVKETNDDYVAITGEENYVFHPNGCTVKDGMVYFVETRPDGLGGLLVYDIDEDSFVLNTETPGYSGDGLITVGNILIMSSWGDGSETGGFLSYYDLDNYPDGEFVMSGATGLNSPADIGVDPFGTICIPSLQTGDIYFYKFSAPGAGYRLLDKVFDFASESGLPFGAGTYAITNDPNRGTYAFINIHTSDTYVPDIHEINADASLNESDSSGFGYEKNQNLRNTVVNAANYGSASYWGLVAVGDFLYTTDLSGLLLEINIAEEDVTNYVELLQSGDSYGDAYLRGVCVDPDDESMLYVADANGYAYSIDTSNDTVELDGEGYLISNEWVVKTIYAGEDILDQNGMYAQSFLPNDCTVSNGKVYFVGTEGPLIIYDTTGETWMYNADVLNVQSYTIASVGNTLVVGIPEGGNEPYVAVSTMSDDGIRSPFQIVATSTQFYFILSVTIDYENGAIVVAGANAGDSYMSFIQSDDLMMEQDTPAPTDSTVAMDSTEETESPTEDNSTPSPTENDSGANNLSIILSIICGLILYLHL
mmetsp:Transcript_50551/g.45322  ORF Transcript_50551/g.45322 Transcript_50551/m.45322 type:complete len:735 (+) Transcript_50551:95-2299(+)